MASSHSAIDERVIPQRIGNYQEFGQRLKDLDLTLQFDDYEDRVRSVSRAWLSLAVEHLEEAKRAVVTNMPRTAYSRAYYSAYNASKSVRFMDRGRVSLKGDDHQKAGELPGNFPDHARWAVDIGVLYEHRLRADYDNWSNSKSENTLSIKQAVQAAEEFVHRCQDFLQTHYRVST